MCGRYTQTRALKDLAERFSAAASPGLELKPRYNLAPSQPAPVVVSQPSGRTVLMLAWGLVPSWAKDPAIGHKMINARAESAAERPGFRRSFRSRRCLVPADGFYEWDKKSRAPFHIRLEDNGLFAFAGLWDSWAGPDGKERRTFTIITTEACPRLEPLHDRMPVILTKAAEGLWMEAKADPEALKRLLIPYAGVKLIAVSKRVNKPANEGPECLQALPAEQPELF